MQQVVQIPAKTKVAVSLTLVITVLFACIFVQQALAASKTPTPITPPITPPNPTSSPFPTPTPSATPSATPQPSPTPVPTNHPPVFKFPEGTSTTVKQGRKVNFSFQVSDADKQRVTVTALSKLPPKLELKCSHDAKLKKPSICTLQGTAEKVGTYTIKLKATDERNASTSATVQLVVTKK
jgi:hypothetical protein